MGLTEPMVARSTSVERGRPANHLEPTPLSPIGWSAHDQLSRLMSSARDLVQGRRAPNPRQSPRRRELVTCNVAVDRPEQALSWPAASRGVGAGSGTFRRVRRISRGVGAGLSHRRPQRNALKTQ